MDEKNKIPPPIEADGMNIHLSYIRRDVDEIKIILKDIKSDYVTRDDFAEHAKIVQDHEIRIRTLEKNMWKWVGASSAISALLALLIQFIFVK